MSASTCETCRIIPDHHLHHLDACDLHCYVEAFGECRDVRYWYRSRLDGHWPASGSRWCRTVADADAFVASLIDGTSWAAIVPAGVSVNYIGEAVAS